MPTVIPDLMACSVKTKPYPKISAKPPLVKAIRYVLSRLPKARFYLRNGHLRADNNVAERAVKSAPLSRKSWVLAGSQGGGEAMAIALNPIETAKLDKADP